MRIASRIVLILSLLATVAGAAQAQFLKSLTDAAKKAAEEETTSQVDRLIRDGVACAFNDFECIRGAEESGKEVLLTDKEGNPIVDEDGNPVQDPEQAAEMMDEGTARPGEGAWASYDFVPGDSVLFLEDFTADNVGDFPRRLEFVRGGMEIVEWQGRRLLRIMASHSRFALPLGATLPDRFTLEFDAYVGHPNAPVIVSTYQLDDHKRAYVSSELPYFFFDGAAGHASGVHQSGQSVAAGEDLRIAEAIVTIRIMVDGNHAKVYVNERRIANHPQLQLERSDRIWFSMPDVWADRPVLLGNIRVAAGGRHLYDRLTEAGRVATQGIMFDLDSDQIRPESTPTLEEIGSMLEQHTELRIAIEGHSDSQGAESHNLDLSRRRAESVRQFLVDEYGIDMSRLEAQGFGEAKPVADNDTPEGRQQNRRVELVKIGV